jgi:hypothetical protein
MITQVLNEKGWLVDTSLVHVSVLLVIFVFLLCCPQLTVPSSVQQQVLIFFCFECAMLVSIM